MPQASIPSSPPRTSILPNPAELLKGKMLCKPLARLNTRSTLCTAELTTLRSKAIPLWSTAPGMEGASITEPHLMICSAAVSPLLKKVEKFLFFQSTVRRYANNQ